MKSVSLFFVASSSYYQRMVDIIASSGRELLSYNFTIIASEYGHLYNYAIDDLTNNRWWEMLPIIYSGLRDNLSLISPISSCSLPLCFSEFNDHDSIPQWLHPRELSFGDLSVISKHHQALKAFLRSTDDFALVCEDDVIFEPTSLRSIHQLAQSLTFDFIDIAGGDHLR